MKSFSSFKLEEAKATYTIKDSEGNIKHAGTDKDMAYKTHKSLNAKEAGHKLYKNGVSCLAEDKEKVEPTLGISIHDPEFKKRRAAAKKKDQSPKTVVKDGKRIYEVLSKLEEASRAETGELFKSLLDRASKASEAGDHTQAKRHLANAQTARYGILAKHIPKHAANFDKYKELKNSYMHSEGTMQPNGTDKIIPDEGMSEGLCQVCGATDCKEHFYKSPAVTGYVKEEADHHEYSISDRDVNKKNEAGVRSVIAKHGAKHTGSSDKGTWFNVHKDKSDAFKRDLKSHGVYADRMDESTAHKVIATAMANSERAKRIQIPTPAERRAQIEKQNKEKQMKESTDKKPYIVISHVSDNTGTRAGGEKVEKSRVATKLIATSPEHALQLSKAHHEKSGRKVHSASIKENISVDEAIDTVKTDEKGKVLAWSHEGDWEKKSTKNKQGAGKAANLAGKALQKTKSLNKEEVDLEEGLFDNMPNTKAGFAYKDKKRSERQAEHEKQDPKMAVHYAKNMVDTAKAAKKAKERGITKHADDFGWQVRNGVQRGKLPEEVELDESAHVYDTKTGKVHSTHDTYKKAVNAMNKLNDKHQGYDTPGGLVQDKFGTKRVNEDLDESAWGKDKATSLRQAHDRHMEKALAANKAGDDQAVKTHQRKMQMIQGKLQKLKNNEEVDLGEECEILSELSKSTMRSYLEKGITKGIQDTFAGKGDISKKREAGLNKAMKKVYGEEVEELDELSKTALGNYAKAAAFDIANKGSAVGKAGNNLAVLANPKGPLTQLNKRLQGHAKAVQKLTKEEVEEFMQTEAYDQLDELSKATLGSYVKKAAEQGKKAAVGANQSGRGATDALSNGNSNLHDLHVDNYKYSKNLEKKRAAGVSKAVDKLTKEGTMVTYKEFMASIEEGRIDDLKDKIAADREKRLNKMDYSKEKEAKKNPITKVKGHSYGAGDEDGEAEPVKAAEPAEKRGRGRPAGSKSGARA